MIQIELMKKVKAQEFVKQNYGAVNPEQLIAADAGEILELFEGENKDEWVVIKYSGKIEEVDTYMSFLTYKVFKKYFIEVTMSKEDSIIEMSHVLEKVADANSYGDGENVISVRSDISLSHGEVMFTLISPRYTYSDMWK